MTARLNRIRGLLLATGLLIFAPAIAFGQRILLGALEDVPAEIVDQPHSLA